MAKAGGLHSCGECRHIAEAYTFLSCVVGSTVHGLTIAEQDDMDIMGVCLEPPEYVVGLRHVTDGLSSGAFEQYISRSKPEGVRSGPGDTDMTIYSARKWMRLALNGNPTVLLLLFVPFSHVIHIDLTGQSLRDNADKIVSREAGNRFARYLEDQRVALISGKGKGTDVTRPELIEAYGFDTKFAAHMVRLGLQGVELLKTGRITLPVPEPHRTWLRELRVGGHTMAEALDAAADLEGQVIELTATSHLPEHPDRAWADGWLIDAYRAAWQDM